MESLTTALALFEDLAGKYAVALQKGNSKKANKNFNKMKQPSFEVFLPG